MNVKQAAEHLGVSEKTIRRLIHKGALTAERVLSRTGWSLNINEQSLKLLDFSRELIKQKKAVPKNKLNSFHLVPRFGDEVFITVKQEKQRVFVETPISDKLYGYFQFPILGGDPPKEFYQIQELTKNCKKTYFYEFRIDKNTLLLCTCRPYTKKMTGYLHLSRSYLLIKFLS
jgi:excisionase family DNA binding protein